MNRKKIAFIILILLVVMLCAFLLMPAPDAGASDETADPQLTQPAGSQEELYEEESSSNQEPDAMQEGINGTYGHYFEEENTTVFVFFDEVHGMYIQEKTNLSNGVPVKSEGNYSLHEDEGLIVIDGVRKSFERKGEDLLIDGVLYGRTQGIILTLF